MTNVATYTDEQAMALLQDELDRWSIADGHLRRHFACNGWRASMLLANGIAHLAEVTWHHPELTIAWGGVTVALRTHSENALTDKDFELARLIESVATWRPGEGSALDGAPNSGEWRYPGND
jgi:4a-hydroxytetrahydrobiopterin dehydratase